MTDPEQPDARPVPRYGEYAPPGYVPPVPEHPIAPVRQDEPAPPRTAARPRWDRAITIALLGLGAVGAYIGVVDGLFFGDRLSQVFEMQGLGTFDGDADVAGTVIWISHLVLYPVAVVLSIRRLRTGRVTFWVPLLFGIIAALIFLIAGTAAILSDPDFVSTYMSRS